MLNSLAGGISLHCNTKPTRELHIEFWSKNCKNKMVWIRAWIDDHGIWAQLIHPLFTATSRSTFMTTKRVPPKSLNARTSSPASGNNWVKYRVQQQARGVKFTRRKKLYLSSHTRHWQLRMDITLQYFWYHLFGLKLRIFTTPMKHWKH